QVVVINQDTAYGIDPYDPNYTHAMQIRPNQRKAEWINTSLEDFNGTYYVMWDDTNFYIACSVEDDSYMSIPEGKFGNSSDGLQFTLTERILDTVKPYIYIPTLGLDASGATIAKNNFNANNFIDYDLFQNSEAQYMGKMDPDTQDWTMELKIPWVLMIGDFQGDLVNGDLDGDGKNVFPPSVGDTVGFAIMAIDYDEGVSEQLAGTHIGSWPWQHSGPATPEGTQSQQPLTFVDANGQLPK
ncbi:MAG: hypothetical protein MI922_19085, partial [Bacteroidales bacterium]|nr:hypothetical protein [Bacteroidales bacterium]